MTTNQIISNNSLCANAKTTNQRIELVALSDMVTESGYQRPTNPKQVAKIAREFNESKLGVLIVSHRDGKFHVIDGSHRAKALRELGLTHALCQVTSMTYEQESDFFMNQNENKRNLNPADTFNAGIEAKNKMCLNINAIVKANGFNIGRSKIDFKQISAIHALFTIVKDYSYDVLDDTLCLIASTWAGIPKASHSEFLLGVAEFVSQYGMVEFVDRMRDKFAVVYFEYCKAMRQGFHGSTKSRKKFCRVLVEQYNKGLRSNQKAYLKWED